MLICILCPSLSFLEGTWCSSTYRLRPFHIINTLNAGQSHDFHLLTPQHIIWLSSTHVDPWFSFLQATWCPSPCEVYHFISLLVFLHSSYDWCGSLIASYGLSWSIGPNPYSPFTTALVLRRQASCLPFTLAWSMVAKSCLSFTITPHETTLFPISSMYSLSHSLRWNIVAMMFNHNINLLLLNQWAINPYLDARTQPNTSTHENSYSRTSGWH